MMTKTISLIHSTIKDFPFEQYGFSQIEKPQSIKAYKKWIHNNYNGEMKYLEDHIDHKESPQSLMPKARSAIVLSRSYLPHPKAETSLFKNLNIALYAQGEDYHFWFKQELSELCDQLKIKFPEHDFINFTDSSPVLERDLACKAGLGWIGKNSCLIHSQFGSFFFIGEIYTSLDLKNFISPHPDRCGKCRRCIEACPTKALNEDRTMDARKCISYLNIESKQIPSKSLQEKINDNFFGCDICQMVCPWNIKKFPSLLKKNKINQKELEDELRFILNLSNKKIMLHLKKSPLNRARGFGLKRNALIVIGNKNLFNLKPEVESLVKNERLASLAKACLEKLNSKLL